MNRHGVLAVALRQDGAPWTDIANTLRSRHQLGPLEAMRVAHDWSADYVAERWNRAWPDLTITDHNLRYWENWPDNTGYAASVASLCRLAELYSCAASDLLTGMADYRHHDARQSWRAKDA